MCGDHGAVYLLDLAPVCGAAGESRSCNLQHSPPPPPLPPDDGQCWAGLGWAGLGWAGIGEGSHLIELSATGHSASRENPNCQ